jgi:dihydrofolate reductase
MGKVLSHMVMSLDGFIAQPDDDPGELFEWYWAGGVTVPSHSDMTFDVDEGSASMLRDLIEDAGVVVAGRRLFDITNGWNGMHPYGLPVVVMTHSVPEDWPHLADAPFTFVTDGLDHALDVAREIAGEKSIGVNAGTIASQCLDAGVLDEVWLSLVPVVLGGGAPFFTGLANAPFDLEGPLSIAPSGRVTHLRYKVRYAA